MRARAEAEAGARGSGAAAQRALRRGRQRAGWRGGARRGRGGAHARARSAAQRRARRRRAPRAEGRAARECTIANTRRRLTLRDSRSTPHRHLSSSRGCGLRAAPRQHLQGPRCDCSTLRCAALSGWRAARTRGGATCSALRLLISMSGACKVLVDEFLRRALAPDGARFRGRSVPPPALEASVLVALSADRGFQILLIVGGTGSGKTRAAKALGARPPPPLVFARDRAVVSHPGFRDPQDALQRMGLVGARGAPQCTAQSRRGALAGALHRHCAAMRRCRSPLGPAAASCGAGPRAAHVRVTSECCADTWAGASRLQQRAELAAALPDALQRPAVARAVRGLLWPRASASA